MYTSKVYFFTGDNQTDVTAAGPTDPVEPTQAPTDTSTQNPQVESDLEEDCDIPLCKYSSLK